MALPDQEFETTMINREGLEWIKQTACKKRWTTLSGEMEIPRKNKKKIAKNKKHDDEMKNAL